MNQLTANAIKGRPKSMQSEATGTLISLHMVACNARSNKNDDKKNIKFRSFCLMQSEDCENGEKKERERDEDKNKNRNSRSVSLSYIRHAESFPVFIQIPSTANSYDIRHDARPR